MREAKVSDIMASLPSVPNLGAVLVSMATSTVTLYPGDGAYVPALATWLPGFFGRLAGPSSGHATDCINGPRSGTGSMGLDPGERLCASHEPVGARY